MFSSDLAIDLGTANTLVYVVGKGIVLNEPSIVAVDRKTRQAMGFGTEAKEMIGRTPANIIAVRPLRDGVIADFELAEEMLTHFIRKANKRHKLLHPRIAIGIPSETTEVEKRAVLDSTYRAKASEVHLVEQAMVAALGAGMPVTNQAATWWWTLAAGLPILRLFRYRELSIQNLYAWPVTRWTTQSPSMLSESTDYSSASVPQKKLSGDWQCLPGRHAADHGGEGAGYGLWAAENHR